MGQQIERLAQFVARTRWEDIPGPVQQHAKLIFLDTLGVILAGSERPEVQQLRERLAPTAGSGATVLARGGPAQDPRTAALLNGIAGRAIELCEGLRLVSGQAAMQVLPGVLAVGEHVQSTGREMLTAFVTGTISPADCAWHSPPGRLRIKTVRPRCWRRSPRAPAYAVST